MQTRRIRLQKGLVKKFMGSCKKLNATGGIFKCPEEIFQPVQSSKQYDSIIGPIMQSPEKVEKFLNEPMVDAWGKALFGYVLSNTLEFYRAACVGNSEGFIVAVTNGAPTDSAVEVSDGLFVEVTGKQVTFYHDGSLCSEDYVFATDKPIGIANLRYCCPSFEDILYEGEPKTVYLCEFGFDVI